MMSLYLIYSGKVMKASRSKMVVGDGEGEVEFVLRLMDILLCNAMEKGSWYNYAQYVTRFNANILKGKKEGLFIE